MKHGQGWRRLVAGAGLAIAPAAWGGEPPAEEPAPPAIEAPARWTIQLEPILWRPALLGDIQLPPGDRFDVELADLDENSLAPAGEATFRTGDDAGDLWFTFGGFHFGSDDDSTASGSFTAGGIDVDRGDRLSYDLDYSSFEGTVEYQLPAIIDEREDEVRWWFNVGAGARLYDLGLDFEVIGEGETSIDSTWIEPMGVARMMLELPYGFDIDTRMTLGGQPLGDDTSWSWDITVGFIWSPHRNFAAEIGFRHLSVDRREGDGNDELIWDNALAGLWWSIVIRF